MVVQMNELNLFSNNPEFAEYDKMIKDANKNKRGHYQKHLKPIIYNPYTEIKDLYRKLANFLPLPLFQTETEVFHYTINENQQNSKNTVANGIKGVTAWYTTYTDEEYEYIDAKFEDEKNGTYQGDNFKVIEAEIDGTENFYVEDRIELHKELISYLSQGITLENAITMLQPSAKRIEKKYKTKELTQWLRELRG